MTENRNLSRRGFIYGATCSLCSAIILPSCANVPISGRKQLNFYEYNLPIILPGGNIFGLPTIFSNETHLNNVVEKSYRDFIKDARSNNILVDNTKESKQIKSIGKNISNSISKYYANKNESNPVSNFNWEFALVDAKDQNGEYIKNAWCMPGGKIAFYTGILPIAKNEDGIASIMGHEIAHAFARHTVEKLTQNSIIALGTQGVLGTSYGKIIAQNAEIFNNVLHFGIMLPFSRTMESEADYMGLAFMSLSGFNLEESVEVWKRMKKANEGSLPPEFMSSHPSPENRIQNIENWIPEIKNNYTTV